MDCFKTYLTTNPDDITSPFSATELISITDSFKDPIFNHLKSKPDIIVGLAKYNTPETPETPIDILGIADAAGKKQLSVGSVFNTLPVFFLNMETAEFEGGMWHGVFPPLKGLAKTVMLQGVPMWQAGRWRFVSCSVDGRVKKLAL